MSACRPATRAVGVVGAGDPRTADLELADALAVPRLHLVVRPEQAAFDAGQQAALGIAVAPVGLGADLDLDGRNRQRADGRHLGHAPAVDDVDVVLVLERANERRRGGRSADHEHRARRDVDGVLVEILQQVVPDRRDACATGDLFGLDHRRQRLGLQEPVGHDQRRAGDHREVGEPPRIGVEERDDDEQVVALADREPVLHSRGVEVVAAVRIGDALGVARRSGGVTHRGRRSRRCLRASRSCGLVGDEGVEVVHALDVLGGLQCRPGLGVDGPLTMTCGRVLRWGSSPLNGLASVLSTMTTLLSACVAT
jgi:hypothetical protein